MAGLQRSAGPGWLAPVAVGWPQLAIQLAFEGRGCLIPGWPQLAGTSWQAYCRLCCNRRPTAGFPAAGRPAAGSQTFWHAYSGYAACGKPIAGFLQLAGLQQGLPQQAFHGQVCYSRFATTRFPGTGLLQQACHNKVSTSTFATAGSQHQVFHSQVCFSRFATTRLPGAGLL